MLRKWHFVAFILWTVCLVQTCSINVIMWTVEWRTLGLLRKSVNVNFIISYIILDSVLSFCFMYLRCSVCLFLHNVHHFISIDLTISSSINLTLVENNIFFADKKKIMLLWYFSCYCVLKTVLKFYSPYRLVLYTVWYCRYSRFIYGIL